MRTGLSLVRNVFGQPANPLPRIPKSETSRDGERDVCEYRDGQCPPATRIEPDRDGVEYLFSPRVYSLRVDSWWKKNTHLHLDLIHFGDMVDVCTPIQDVSSPFATRERDPQ